MVDFEHLDPEENEDCDDCIGGKGSVMLAYRGNYITFCKRCAEAAAAQLLALVESSKMVL
jgi:hypothetical protein